MGTSRFGGAADFSQVFAALYSNYTRELEDRARAALAKERDERRNRDQDTIDRWEKGEITDEEFLAYANERIADSDARSDEDEATYWRKALRSAEKSILADDISETAEDIVDRIESGTGTWEELADHYRTQMRNLRPNDPLYKQLDDEVNKVEDRIRDNATAGELERIEYDVKRGALSGPEAAAQIRAIAERYKTSDPERYYQLLSGALDFEQYSASGGGGGGGSTGGGGGGGGGSTASLSSTIDALDGWSDRLESLSEQFEDGVIVGQITVENEDGSISTEEVLLRNPDGTPSTQMQAVDQEFLSTVDQLEAAYIEKGDRSAAGAQANRRMQFVTDHIQPRNTIGPEQQAAALFQTGMGLVRGAAESDNPAADWQAVEQWARRVAVWEGRVNVTTRTTGARREFTDEELDRNPELKQTRYTTETISKPAEERTTGEGKFTSQAAALRVLAQGITTAKDGDAARALEEALDVFMGGDDSPIALATRSAGSSFIDDLSVAVEVVRGQEAGTVVRVLLPDGSMAWMPLSTTNDIQWTATGPVSVPRNTILDPQTRQPITEQGQTLQAIMVERDGRIETVVAIADLFYQNADDPGDVLGEEAYLGLSPEDRGKYQQYQGIMVPTPRGEQVWIKSGDLWYRNRVTEYGGVPIPFAGRNAREAQQFATQAGWDTSGRAYNPLPAQQQEHLRREGSERLSRDWYQSKKDAEREETRRNARANAFGLRTPTRASQLRYANPQQFRQMAQQFGIRLLEHREREYAPVPLPPPPPPPSVSVAIQQQAALRETIATQTTPASFSQQTSLTRLQEAAQTTTDTNRLTRTRRAIY